jgi:multidrug efflux pump subunit AcrA (membrane-fusion protein)
MPRHPPRPAAHLSVPAWPGRDFEAHVVDQSGAVNSQNGSVQVQLMTDNPGGALKPGGFAQVRFDLPVPAGRLTVPASALILRGGGTRGHRGCGRPCASLKVKSATIRATRWKSPPG